MRHRLQLRHESREPRIVEQKRVSAGEDHLTDRRIHRDAMKRRLDAGLGRAALGIGELTAKTVAAVDRAAAGRQQQRAAGILLHEPR